LAKAYGNLGNVLYTRGDLDGAEAMHRKSLEIEERLGRPEGMASDYGSLGLVLRTRGDLDGARRLWQRSLELFQQVGMPHRVELVQGWLENLRSGDDEAG
jgi:Flp pilus assembly protein TadD